MSQTTRPFLSRPARERILDAAVGLFSRKSYDAIAWREIAAEARVDVAYAHRSFGTKKELFRQVLRQTGAAERLGELFDGPGETLPRRLARRIAACSAQGSQPGKPGAFEMALLSSTSIEARAAVQEFLDEEFLRPLARQLGHDADMSRAALIMSLLAGIDVMRSVIGAAAMASLDEDWLASAIEKLIGHAAALPAP